MKETDSNGARVKPRDVLVCPECASILVFNQACELEEASLNTLMGWTQNQRNVVFAKQDEVNRERANK